MERVEEETVRETGDDMEKMKKQENSSDGEEREGNANRFTQ